MPLWVGVRLQGLLVHQAAVELSLPGTWGAALEKLFIRFRWDTEFPQ